MPNPSENNVKNKIKKIFPPGFFPVSSFSPYGGTDDGI
jgi:hypothetical protein